MVQPSSSSSRPPASGLQPSSVWIVANPIAGGRGGQRRLRQAIDLLQSRLPVGEVRWTEKRGDAEEWAREAVAKKIDLLIGAGGDGTLNEIANSLAASNVALGILPVGTANVVACELGIPRNAVRAAKSLLAGKIKRICLGCAEYQPFPDNLAATASAHNATPDTQRSPLERKATRRFLFAAGLGFDAYVCHNVNLTFKSWARKTAYVVDGFRLFVAYPSPRLRVILDGNEPLAASEFIVCNMHRYAGRFWIAPDASADQPHLDACLFSRPGRLNLLRYAFGILFGRHVNYSDFTCRRCETVDVTAQGPAYLQIDGDAVGTPPARFSIEPNALAVVVPSP